MISLHIFPGVNNFLYVEEEFWIPSYTDRFTQIMHNYQSKIKLITGAHIHRAGFRDASSSSLPDLNIPIFISPSISPVYQNNPGYTTFDFDG